jgi:hypothetical protein
MKKLEPCQDIHLPRVIKLIKQSQNEIIPVSKMLKKGTRNTSPFYSFTLPKHFILCYSNSLRLKPVSGTIWWVPHLLCFFCPLPTPMLGKQSISCVYLLKTRDTAMMSVRCLLYSVSLLLPTFLLFCVITNKYKYYPKHYACASAASQFSYLFSCKFFVFRNWCLKALIQPFWGKTKQEPQENLSSLWTGRLMDK